MKKTALLLSLLVLTVTIPGHAQMIDRGTAIASLVTVSALSGAGLTLLALNDQTQIMSPGILLMGWVTAWIAGGALTSHLVHNQTDNSLVSIANRIINRLASTNFASSINSAALSKDDMDVSNTAAKDRLCTMGICAGISGTVSLVLAGLGAGLNFYCNETIAVK